jgi:hypothetical protein
MRFVVPMKRKNNSAMSGGGRRGGKEPRSKERLAIRLRAGL